LKNVNRAPGNKIDKKAGSFSSADAVNRGKEDEMKQMKSGKRKDSRQET
jgi:hypothetical protein